MVSPGSDNGAGEWPISFVKVVKKFIFLLNINLILSARVSNINLTVFVTVSVLNLT